MIEPKTVEVNFEDVQTFAISSLRYALGRRTYITSSTAFAIMNLPKEVFDKRVLEVMIRDLSDYFTNRASATDHWLFNKVPEEKRKENEEKLRTAKYVDDSCDYDSWKSLYAFLRKTYTKLLDGEEKRKETEVK